MIKIRHRRHTHTQSWLKSQCLNGLYLLLSGYRLVNKYIFIAWKYISHALLVGANVWRIYTQLSELADPNTSSSRQILQVL